jgi:hypothetical protein
VPLDRRLLTLAASLVATLVFSTGVAAAHSRPARSKHVTGVVAKLDVTAHTLKLDVKQGTRQHAHGASVHTPAHGGRTTLDVSFGGATVGGEGGGTVAVGDEVTVTESSATGSTAVANAIDVIGQPNGGDAGKGAAVPGAVTAVDPADGTLTLAVSSTDAQGQPQNASVAVSVSAATILAVSDTNGDGRITLADIGVGDHVVVFTEDATASPIAAVGILDASNAGANCHDGDRSPQGDSGSTGGGPERNSGADVTYQGFSAKVVALPTGGLQVYVIDGSLAGQTVTVEATSSTRFKGIASLDGVAVGDIVRVYATSLDPQPIVAVFVGDTTSSSGDSQPSSTPPAQPAGDPSGPGRFGGVVTDVRGDGLTVKVTSGGPLSGQVVVVSVPSSATLVAVASLSDINVGDAVEIHTDDEGGSPVVATEVIEDGSPPA